MAQWLKVNVALVEDPGFTSQHPHGVSQTPVTLASGDPMSASSLWETRHTCGAHMYTQAKHPYT